ncbi:MAG: Tad domain-containing protein [Actinomycetes bacterium]
MREPTMDNSERGSVLTFGIGLAILLLMLVTVSVNLASVWTTKVTLRTITDGAALSGAQAVDLTHVYESGAYNSLHLSPKSARIRVDKYLQQPSVRKRVHGLQIVSTTVAGDQIKVVLSCEPQLPFGYLLPVHISRIQAVAIAKQFTH